MIELLLPPEVVCAERRSDVPDDCLFPEERPAVARAVGSRRSEFATGRACARSALAQLGVPPIPLPQGERGAPSWPEGVTGSITHCVGYRAAAAARSSQIAALGIDAEPDQPLPEGVLSIVSSPTERDRLDTLPSGIHWDRLLFSAKEAIYKAWFTLTRCYLDFGEADLALRLDPGDRLVSGTFLGRLLVPGPVLHGQTVKEFRGTWRADSDLLLTAVVVRRPAAHGTPP
ncbi:4'-phosphopantetheinyl transferase EntD [Mumia flava]|uniref:4'-phosphopantetheinyl transferase EntD n=1 Tax=Mumia flava TaxID=1348852 RepID=A0A0B2B2L4_9ACTN|nr:4'-phosphopantetheinyl transferase superfamily protein [Mumia flava]PJJ54119.1 4'-phosphopantetheinyl transferase EntD [Mumia flava]